MIRIYYTFLLYSKHVGQCSQLMTNFEIASIVENGLSISPGRISPHPLDHMNRSQEH